MATRYELQTLSNHLITGNVRLVGRELGRGSYGGGVEELMVNGVVCVGKKIPEFLIEQSFLSGAENIATRFVEECKLMSHLSHPHLVQFLGVCFLPNATLPMLVMERLLTDLHNLLEHNPDIPLSLKRSILTDVAKGLVYLHKRDPPVIHRDLTAREILLNSAMVAKIGGLGTACSINIHTQLANDLIIIPGTLVYMPPEAMDSDPMYGRSLDCFSFGHLSLFTITQVPPFELLPPVYEDPQSGRLIARTEVERRDRYIQLLKQQLAEPHPLMRLIKSCLDNDPSKRPRAEELLQALEGMQDQIVDGYMSHTSKLDDYFQIQALQRQQASISSGEELEALQAQMDQLQLESSGRLTDMQRSLEQKDDEIISYQRDSQRLQEELGHQLQHQRLEFPTDLSSFRGANVIGETRITVSNVGGVFQWQGYGLKIHIPRNSLPNGCEYCTVTITASLTGQFQLDPEDSKLVSPVFWISSTERFSQPVTIEIQHCAIIDDTDSISDLRFVTAKRNQPDLPYKFRSLDGGVFTPHSTHGSISLTHFCAQACTSKRSRPQGYCAQFFTVSKGLGEWRVYFVITKNLEAALTVVNQRYGHLDRICDRTQLKVIFERHEIQLDIPDEGISSSGWSIMLKTYPSISRQDANQFEPGLMLPACELIVRWEKESQKPAFLRQRIGLKGAKSPRNFFNLIINPDWEFRGRETHAAPIQENKPTLRELTTALYHQVADKWNVIGIHLNIPPETLSIVAQNKNYIPQDCLVEMLTIWLQKMDPPPTWIAIINAVEFAGNGKLATDLRTKYCQQL